MGVYDSGWDAKQSGWATTHANKQRKMWLGMGLVEVLGVTPFRLWDILVHMRTRPVA